MASYSTIRLLEIGGHLHPLNAVDGVASESRASMASLSGCRRRKRICTLVIEISGSHRGRGPARSGRHSGSSASPSNSVQQLHRQGAVAGVEFRVRIRRDVRGDPRVQDFRDGLGHGLLGSRLETERNFRALDGGDQQFRELHEPPHDD